jgi:hypothetical protein
VSEGRFEPYVHQWCAASSRWGRQEMGALSRFTVVPQFAFPADLDEPSWRSRGSQAEALWTYHDQRARKEEP